MELLSSWNGNEQEEHGDIRLLFDLPKTDLLHFVLMTTSGLAVTRSRQYAAVASNQACCFLGNNDAMAKVKAILR